MKRLIYSKHLVTERKGDAYLIHNALNGASVEVSKDLFSLLEQFKAPASLVDISPDGRCSQFIEALKELERKRILNDSGDDEEYLLFKKWIDSYNKQIFTWNVNEEIELRYGCRVNEPISNFTQELARLAVELSHEFRPWKRPIHLCYLSPDEQEKVSGKYNFPKNLTGFVDARTVLLLNYSLFFDPANSHLFYPTIRHELMHILLGQYRVNIPVWLEEGICELFSKRADIKELNKALTGTEIAPFSAISSSNEYNLSDYNIKSISLDSFYIQATSFTHFIMNTTGEAVFWKIVDKAGLIQNFEDNILLYTNKTLREFEVNWKNSLAGIK